MASPVHMPCIMKIDQLGPDQLAAVTGGFKLPKGAVVLPKWLGGGWEVDRAKHGSQARYISPDGKKSKWRPFGEGE